tara:strand:- start:753 stop:959 length:207 start_codon:yes stop_codon:yes gene_type:complete
MSLTTALLLILGVTSFLIFFYLLRFKASTKQTNRGNRLKWASYFSYKERKTNLEGKKSVSEEDAQFKD